MPLMRHNHDDHGNMVCRGQSALRSLHLSYSIFVSFTPAAAVPRVMSLRRSRGFNERVVPVHLHHYARGMHPQLRLILGLMELLTAIYPSF